MAKVLTDSQHYTDIANAIREKNGEETAYKPSEMAGAIQAIQSGGADFSEVEYKLSGGFTDYSYYFSDLDQMTEVPMEILQNTSRGTDFDYMFNGCSGLTTMPLFDTSLGIGFGHMFDGCSKLTSVPQFNTSRSRDFGGMFKGCKSLTIVPELDTSNGTSFGDMFNNCNALTTIPKLDTSNGTTVAQMFYGCTALTTIPELDTSTSDNFRNMFYSCYALTTIQGIDLSSATNVNNLFYRCSKLENITINGVIKITGLSFSPCTLLTHDSLMSIINALYDYAAEGSTGTYTLTLGTTNLAKLTDAEKAIATQKGWTLA